MNANSFRRIALGMDGALEGAHMGHPDFRANGRIFATLHPGNERGMVKLTPEQQGHFIHVHPDAFEPENGAWGRQGCTRVRLEGLDEETLGEAMTLAWQAALTQPPPRRTSSNRVSRPTTAGRRRKAR